MQKQYIPLRGNLNGNAHSKEIIIMQVPYFWLITPLVWASIFAYPSTTLIINSHLFFLSVQGQKSGIGKFPTFCVNCSGFQELPEKTLCFHKIEWSWFDELQLVPKVSIWPFTQVKNLLLVTFRASQIFVIENMAAETRHILMDFILSMAKLNKYCQNLCHTYFALPSCITVQFIWKPAKADESSSVI